MKSILMLFIITAFMKTAYASPVASWYLDELGNSNYAYILDDAVNNNDGKAFNVPSTGSSSGKICSALDFSASSKNDFAILDENALDGAQDFTISYWHKGNSTSEKALLSGARMAQKNELLMWFNNGTRFNGYIDGVASSSINFPSIADNQWHHIVWRRAGGTGCFFTDGVERGCTSVRTKTLEIESLILGQEQDSVGGHFDINQDWESWVDELLVFKSALTNTEIQSIYSYQDQGKSWNGGSRTCLTTAPQGLAVDYDYSDWHFDESSWGGASNEVHDSHGGQHGIAYNVSPVPGKICNAMDLRASSSLDYAKLGAESLNGAHDFTVSIWHKGSSNKGKAILSGAVAGSDNELLFWFSSSTRFNSTLKSTALGSVNISNITDNSWHHLVWKRTGMRSCFYIDGQLEGCQSRNSSAALNITSLVVGQDQDTVGGGFDSSQDWEGLLDELIIFRRSLRDGEITSIYNNQNNGKNWDGTHRACPQEPAMSLTKTSIIISDPVNQTNNPKRIPGALIRYTLSAKNAHEATADNIIIKDDLSDEIAAGVINWLGNVNVMSPNINTGSTTLLTDALDTDEGEFVENILSVRCGSIDNSAPCVVEYDIKISQ